MIKDDSTPDDEWIDIDQARELTGKSRETLMRWKNAKAIETRLEEADFTQKQKRLFFRKSDLLREAKGAGDEV